MKMEIMLTEDGSHSIGMDGTGITYHSRYGAIQESKHVYIEAGLNQLLNKKPSINIFEMGLGTGLNALLTLISTAGNAQQTYYETIEPNPLENHFVGQLNYCQQLQQTTLQPVFEQFHHCPWDQELSVAPLFTFRKIKTSLQDFEFAASFDLMFYDAFAPNAQPELWTEAIFKKLYAALLPDGLLVTYCSKGDVQRAMKSAGFMVEKLPGPRHKREMVRAVKK